MRLQAALLLMKHEKQPAINVVSQARWNAMKAQSEAALLQHLLEIEERKQAWNKAYGFSHPIDAARVEVARTELLSTIDGRWWEMLTQPLL
jgi:hypothetical protein